MKKLISFTILFFVLLLLCGCSADDNGQVSTKSDGKSTVYESDSDTADDSSAISDSGVVSGIENSDPSDNANQGGDDVPPQENSITFYTIWRDDFLNYLQAPSLDILKQKNEASQTVSKSGEKYYVYELWGFLVTDEMLAFWGDTQKVCEYLSKDASSEKPEYMAVLDTPRVPLTLSVKFASEAYYITVEKNEDTSKYEYAKYTQNEYNGIYGCKTGDLTVGTKTFEDAAKIYNGYADIPLTVVLKALGATVSPIDENKASVSYNSKTYTVTFDRPSVSLTGQGENILHIDGGVTFVYSEGKDIMLDNATLSHVLHKMGYEANFECTKDSVVITERKEEA